MKRTTAIVSVVLVLSVLSAGVSVFVPASCQRPCHPAPAPCHHEGQTATIAVQCDCHHGAGEPLLARVENGPAPELYFFTVSSPALTPIDPSVPGEYLPSLSPGVRSPIFCLTRSYRI